METADHFGNRRTGECHGSGGSGGKVLLIAYHFPPAALSTGHLRVLGFMRHLPSFGWEPAILSARPAAYDRVDTEGLAQVPAGYPVYRAFALNARHHFGWRGKFPVILALPDRWSSWWPDAVRAGLHLIRRHRIDVIWSTYPIMTSHLIALTLSHITGLPWVADFRDPMVPGNDTPLTHKLCNFLERKTMARAARVVFTTPGACRLYKERFPASEQKLGVIPNGYEEGVFADIADRSRSGGGTRMLVHSGLLYRQGRDPAPFFRALASLREKGKVDADRYRIVLRASGNEEEYRQALLRLGIGDLVELAPPVSHEQAVREQFSADALLLFQDHRFNAQIPAKVYEYLRIGRPIFALVDPAGDTAALLRKTGGATQVSPDDHAAIGHALEGFLPRMQRGELEAADAHVVEQYSRRSGAESFAHLLDAVKESP